VYIQVKKGMYGLAQAGILANKMLNKRLAAHGYYHPWLLEASILTYLLCACCR